MHSSEAQVSNEASVAMMLLLAAIIWPLLLAAIIGRYYWPLSGLLRDVLLVVGFLDRVALHADHRPVDQTEMMQLEDHVDPLPDQDDIVLLVIVLHCEVFVVDADDYLFHFDFLVAFATGCLLIYGDGGTRTHKGFRPTNFESAMFTNSKHIAKEGDPIKRKLQIIIPIKRKAGKSCHQ